MLCMCIIYVYVCDRLVRNQRDRPKKVRRNVGIEGKEKNKTFLCYIYIKRKRLCFVPHSP